MANPQNLQPPFVKGDKRINRNGRPKSFDALRKLAVKIAGETIPGANGDDITRIEAMLRVLTSSKNPADRALFLAYAYGKPKDEIDLKANGALTFHVVHDDDERIQNTSPEPIPSQATGSDTQQGEAQGASVGQASGKDED